MAFGLLALVLLASSGCPALTQAVLEREHLLERVDDYIYDRPLKHVWPVAREMLVERGYLLRDVGDQAMGTEWRHQGEQRVRFEVEGHELGPDRCQVQFTRHVEHLTGALGMETWRDLDMEWMLIESVDPDRAGRLAAEARASAGSRNAKNH